MEAPLNPPLNPPLSRWPARALAQAVRAREVSAREVLQAHLDAIARGNAPLNAIVTLAADHARASADAIDAAIARGEPPGPLAGVPVGIKDVTATAGIRTTYGSTLYADHVPVEDAEVVKRLRAAGAIVIGKTNTPEFAAGANTVNAVFGATRNPWDLRMSASGSTGGGAAALAAGLVPLAEGSDFGGSLRTPAAFCGVVGLRTTAGLVARAPMNLPWHAQSVAGPMARDAADCALMLDAMTGYSACSPLSVAPPWSSAFEAVARADDLRGMRLAYAPDIGRAGIDPQIARICADAARRLEAAGASVEEIDADFSDGIAAFVTLRAESMVGNHLERIGADGRVHPAINRNLAGNIARGLELSVLDTARAERKRGEIFQRWRTLFERFDLVLTPTTAVPPFPVEQNFPTAIGDRRLDDYIAWIAQTFLVSLAALPAASAPVGRTAAGLPIGLQIVGPRFAEPRILTCAKLAERTAPAGWPPHAA